MTRRIGFLIYPDFQLLDAAGPISAFEVGGEIAGGAYALVVLAKGGGSVVSSSSASLAAAPLEAAGELDTLVIAGGQGSREAAKDPELIGFIREQADRARRVASICSGAYLLAEAGLLDGRRATTHWGRCQDFQRKYPKVRLEPDRIFVRDGQVWTSAGVTAGIDLSLALIADDLGEAAALGTAQELVVYRRRPGGQSQFSALLELERPDGRFGALLGWARERLDQPLDVETLAGQAAMSPRNFTRRFTAETGLSPARAIERLRVEAARVEVETGQASIDLIALRMGFGDQERMRRAFVRAFGLPPQALRRTASASRPTRRRELSAPAAAPPRP